MKGGEDMKKAITHYEVALTPTPNWYCIREVYADGDFKAVGNGTLKRCKLWVDCMNYLLEKGEPIN